MSATTTSVTPTNRNGLALSDQPGFTVIYFLSHCAHWAEAKRRAEEMRVAGETLWEFVELLALCYRDIAVAQGHQYTSECSVDSRVRRWLGPMGIAPASPEQLAALRAEDATSGRYTLAAQAAEDYFAACATEEAL